MWFGPFNSLSRDHRGHAEQNLGDVREAFNSLSRDHLSASAAPATLPDALSTPSLGITG